MRRTRDGAFCTKCEKNVVDLRRTPRKRALAMIADLRAANDGQVCVRVRATRDGVPVFVEGPSFAGRLAMPLALAGSLAACAPSAATPRDTTPVVAVSLPLDGPSRTNGNATPPAPPRVVGVPSPGARPAPVNLSTPPDIVEMAGGLG